MADEIVVKGATVSLSGTVATIVKTSHTLSSAASGPFATGEGKEMLLESDVDLSFASYTTSYSKGSYAGGMLMYQSLKSISNLSELTKKSGEPVVLKKTKGTITCSVSSPAQMPTSGGPQPDSTLTYDLDFSFTDAAQTLAKSD